MSLLRVIAGIDHDGTKHTIIADTNGHLVCLGFNQHAAHRGKVFHCSQAFGEIADDAEIALLMTVGATKDAHILDMSGAFEGSWALQAFEDPELTSVGTVLPLCKDLNRFIAGTSNVTMTQTPVAVNTTVDANSASGQKILNVTATAGFAADGWILIDDGETGVANNEPAQVDTIQDGVSLTMKENLLNTYTNETVVATGLRLMDMHTEGGEKRDLGGSAAETGNWIFKSGSSYFLRMRNRSDADARGSFKMYWLEEDKQT